MYDVCPLFRFTVYKLPEIHEIGIDPLSYDGVGFYYMDAVTPSWKLSQVGFNDTGHSVEYTLRQIYKNVSLKGFLIFELVLLYLLQLIRMKTVQYWILKNI